MDVTKGKTKFSKLSQYVPRPSILSWPASLRHPALAPPSRKPQDQPNNTWAVPFDRRPSSSAVPSDDDLWGWRVPRHPSVHWRHDSGQPIAPCKQINLGQRSSERNVLDRENTEEQRTRKIYELRSYSAPLGREATSPGTPWFGGPIGRWAAAPDRRAAPGK